MKFKASDNLMVAAQWVELLGHGKRTFLGQRTGRVCAFGALDLADSCLVSFKYLQSVVQAPIPCWNDRPETTQRDVVRALRLAARLAYEAGE